MKQKKTKIIVILAVVVVVIASIVAAVLLFFKHKENKMINELKAIIEESNQELPSQEKFDNFLEVYNSVEQKIKAQVNGEEYVKKYSDVDLAKVSDLRSKINILNEDSRFAEILEIKKQIEEMTEKEKKLVDTIPMENLMRLSEEEEAVLSAAENVKSVMKSRGDFKLNEASVKNDLEKMNFYWVKLGYSGQNGFGATVDKTSFFGIGSDFKDPFFGLAYLTGMDDYLDNIANYSEYEKCTKDEISIDVDKIQYFMENK